MNPRYTQADWLSARWDATLAELNAASRNAVRPPYISIPARPQEGLTISDIVVTAITQACRDNPNLIDIAIAARHAEVVQEERKRLQNEIVQRSRKASIALGSWMSAALEDPEVCDAMKSDIREWVSSGEPGPVHFATTEPTVIPDFWALVERVETQVAAIAEPTGEHIDTLRTQLATSHAEAAQLHKHLRSVLQHGIYHNSGCWYHGGHDCNCGHDELVLHIQQAIKDTPL